MQDQHKRYAFDDEDSHSAAKSQQLAERHRLEVGRGGGDSSSNIDLDRDSKALESDLWRSSDRQQSEHHSSNLALSIAKSVQMQRLVL